MEQEENGVSATIHLPLWEHMISFLKRTPPQEKDIFSWRELHHSFRQEEAHKPIVQSASLALLPWQGRILWSRRTFGLANAVAPTLSDLLKSNVDIRLLRNIQPERSHIFILWIWHEDLDNVTNQQWLPLILVNNTITIPFALATSGCTWKLKEQINSSVG